MHAMRLNVAQAVGALNVLHECANRGAFGAALVVMRYLARTGSGRDKVRED